MSKELNIDEVSQSAMSLLRKKYHLNVDVPKKGSTFAKCIICEYLKNLISKVGKNSASAKEHELKMKRHKSIKSHVDIFIIVGNQSPFNQRNNFCVSFMVRWII